jgi:hypothetical protein
MSWSNDSTQLACGCGTGRVGIGHIIERYWINCCILIWKNISIYLF